LAPSLERWALESDLHSYTTTGKWVDDTVPEWAAKEAHDSGRDPSDCRVIYAGYRMLVKMLHDEVTRENDRAEMYKDMQLGSDW
jgi:hypothetical protein